MEFTNTATHGRVLESQLPSLVGHRIKQIAFDSRRDFTRPLCNSPLVRRSRERERERERDQISHLNPDWARTCTSEQCRLESFRGFQGGSNDFGSFEEAAGSNGNGEEIETEHLPETNPLSTIEIILHDRRLELKIRFGAHWFIWFHWERRIAFGAGWPTRFRRSAAHGQAEGWSERQSVCSILVISWVAVSGKLIELIDFWWRWITRSIEPQATWPA